METIAVGGGHLARLVKPIEPEDGCALLEVCLGEAEAQTPSCAGDNDCGHASFFVRETADVRALRTIRPFRVFYQRGVASKDSWKLTVPCGTGPSRGSASDTSSGASA